VWKCKQAVGIGLENQYLVEKLYANLEILCYKLFKINIKYFTVKNRYLIRGFQSRIPKMNQNLQIKNHVWITYDPKLVLCY